MGCTVVGHDEFAAEGAAVHGIVEEGGLACLFFPGGLGDQGLLFGFLRRLSEHRLLGGVRS